MKKNFEHIILRFDQTFSGKLRVQILFILVLFLLFCFIFSVANSFVSKEPFTEIFCKTFINMISPVTLRNAVYNYESNSLLFIIFHCFIYLIGVVIWSGLLIATLANILKRRSDNFKQGLLRYSFEKHVVICGRDRCTPILIKQLVKKKHDTKIVVLSDEDILGLHYSLLSELDKKDEDRVIFYRGNRNSLKDLETLNIPYASEIYIFGQPEEVDSDLKNLNCLNLISNICSDTVDKPRCYVSLSDLNAHALTRTSNALTETQKANIEFSSINFEESWAKIVLVDNVTHKSKIKYQPLDRSGISQTSTKYVHLVIWGMSKIGESLALLAAHIAHYPNFVTKSIKTKITLIDENIVSRKDDFCHKYETYFSLTKQTHKTFKESSVEVKEYSPVNDYLDIEWEFIESNPTNIQVRKYLEQISKNPDAILTLALCYDSAEKNNNIAFYLPETLYSSSVQILTKQNISTLISRYSGNKYSNIKPFGMIDEGISDDMDKTERYAKMLNFNYYYNRFPEFSDAQQVNDAWKKLPVVKRWSNMYSAMTIPSYWRSITCMDDDFKQIMSEVEHNRWNTEELLLGYRPVNEQEYAEVCRNPEYKNELKKNYIHFDIRPYEDLEKIDHYNVCAFDMMKIDFVLQCHKE